MPTQHVCFSLIFIFFLTVSWWISFGRILTYKALFLPSSWINFSWRKICPSLGWVVRACSSLNHMNQFFVRKILPQFGLTTMLLSCPALVGTSQIFHQKDSLDSADSLAGNTSPENHALSSFWIYKASGSSFFFFFFQRHCWELALSEFGVALHGSIYGHHSYNCPSINLCNFAQWG